MKKIISLVLTAVLTLFLFGCKGSADGNFGSVQIQVIDGMSRQPIEGARVVIPEIDAECLTADDGKSEYFKIPVREDERFDNIQKQPWGCFTVLVYKDGYARYALFYAQIKTNETRDDMKAFLFEESSSMANGAPFSIIESPAEDWVEQVIEKYEK